MHKLSVCLAIVALIFACGLHAVQVTVVLDDHSELQGEVVSIGTYSISIQQAGTGETRTLTAQFTQGFYSESSSALIMFPLDETMLPEDLAPFWQSHTTTVRKRWAESRPDWYVGPSFGVGLGFMSSNDINDIYHPWEPGPALAFSAGGILGYRDYGRLEFRYGFRSTTMSYVDETDEDDFKLKSTTYRFLLKLAPWNLNDSHDPSKPTVYLVGGLGGSKLKDDAAHFEYTEGSTSIVGFEVSFYRATTSEQPPFCFSGSLDYEMTKYSKIKVPEYGTASIDTRTSIIWLRFQFDICIPLKTGPRP